jgi:hypothetical protein
MSKPWGGGRYNAILEFKRGENKIFMRKKKKKNKKERKRYMRKREK